MLLTGFDTPAEQVLYLDRSMKEAELLQAVARVNRPADGKKCGYVIDYVGVTNHLTQALKAYSAEDIQGALKDLRTEIGHLGPQRDRIRLLFAERGVAPGHDEHAIEDCVVLLEDGPPRARASEMEHAIRHHIDVHFSEDPARYRRLSERLEQILAEHKGNWDQQALFLGELLEEIKTHEAERPNGGSSLNRIEEALYALILETTATDGVITAQQGQRIGDFARRLYALSTAVTTRVDFWRRPVDWEEFKKDITAGIIEHGICPDDEAMSLSDALFEVIKANRRRIQRPDTGSGG